MKKGRSVKLIREDASSSIHSLKSSTDFVALWQDREKMRPRSPDLSEARKTRIPNANKFSKKENRYLFPILIWCQKFNKILGNRIHYCMNNRLFQKFFKGISI